MANRIKVRELRAREGAETEEDFDKLLGDCVMGVRDTPALCSEGCEVEPDGACEHGFPSLLVELLFI